MSPYPIESKHHYDMEKFVAVVGYLTIFGWLIAVLVHGNNRSEFARFHLRQSLGLILTSLICCFIPLVGWILMIPVFVMWLVAIFHTLNGQQVLTPLLGEFFQEHLDFIR
ncbi:hypothetical protein [Thalassotalea agarivorans]|uniref:Uncharacterized membrane protein n=1 Tax=Thalassotalea agarivorans TaxID=349064 RepID=A0A1I0EVK7_THASX|nr:hypothetical protein [Thalassotalea agarivorans]SET49676.1 Uncharacterized membrane protein [Thalassotalea agarivorans]